MTSHSIKDTVAQQFDPAAASYRTSSVHAAGEDLAQLVALAELAGREAVLDAGSGAGHTALAFAPHVRSVLSVDLAPSMLTQAERRRRNAASPTSSFARAMSRRCPSPMDCLTWLSRATAPITGRTRSGHWPSSAACCCPVAACC